MDRTQLIERYTDVVGKKPYHGWGEDELLKKIDEAQKENSKDKDKITLSKNELQNMIDEATQKALSSQVDREPNFSDWQEYTPPKNNNKTATLKLYQPSSDAPLGVITKVDYLKTTWNEEEHKFNKVLYRIEVTYDDGSTKNYDIDVNEYVTLNRQEKVELIDVERKILKKSDGRTMLNLPNNQGAIIRNANSGQYGVVMGGEYEVDLDVYKIDETFTVKRKNGQTFQIHSKYLNN